ncbi:ABC transporter permease [Thermococcus sp. 4557]|uniref:ABC transporter permease subunit n=1 Tax=Thermococcus sp. (strain CGMCC 1.5172 / 4557) TaxID=1042877 RepID=UPI000219EC23|nr:ABC transporter permease subunit [Thermococcus sp. 4557]AEK73429.1 ABC transporter permease [Thermococcus sp. 4557]
MWGFELELKKSLRTKKFWLILVLILLIYAMTFREVRDNLEGATNPQEVLVTSVVGYIAVSAFLFIGVYALMAGATAVNSDLEDGTVRVVLSKPLGRVSYLLGKFLGQALSIVVAMAFATLLSFAITKYYGLSLTAALVGDLVLSNLLVLLAMLQLLALGLLISTLIRSSNTALGLALVIFFVTGLVMPQVVDGLAEDKAREEFGIQKWGDFSKLSPEEKRAYRERLDELYEEYHLRYLFYAPQVIMLDVFTDIDRTTFNDDGTYTVEYRGVKRAITDNPAQTALIAGLAPVYLGLALMRFRRMDLR